MPEARVGMGANFGSVILPRLIPRAHALDILYTGERFDVQRAYELGLINRIAPKKDLETATQA
jgi:enoyl-CoA hydratase/carnithine racemase